MHLGRAFLFGISLGFGIAFGLVWAATCPAKADALRVAMYNTELDRDGPGLLLRDILNGADDIEGVAHVVRAADADILLLTRFDYDHGLAALVAFNGLLGPHAYPHVFARRPNTGRFTGMDIDRDGRAGEPEDSQSFGAFAGQNGMAILSRFPFVAEDVRDFSELLWRDLPNARLPQNGDDPFWPAEVLDELRLSTVGHWDVPVVLPDGDRIHLWAFHGSPPVFDGPEDRNGLRAADEVAFWQRYLDGALEHEPSENPFVILGTANIDPVLGEGRHDAIRALLDDPRTQDPEPKSVGAADQGRSTDTVDWAEDVQSGNLRVDYVIPDARLNVLDTGVIWPSASDPNPAVPFEKVNASRHRLVWVDIAMPAAETTDLSQ
ncbi:MAG: endonuclease/exonuclease/phosphatase family protein [Pseudomonadota bacterium]